MGYLGRRVVKSQNTGTDADGANGNLGGGILDLFAQGYFAREGNINRSPGVNPGGHSASGGVINDYTEPGGNVYRAHVFTSSGTFNVTEVGTFESTVEYLVVAGGGAGGTGYYGGGGGAGGLRTNLSGHPKAGSAYPISASPGSYTITIGGGGQFSPNVDARGSNGSNSQFGPPNVSSPEAIVSFGGGGGGSRGPSVRDGSPGGSGGGACSTPSTGGNGNTPPTSPPQGNDGGDCPGSPDYGAGGGGAGEGGQNGRSPYGNRGGDGVQVLIAGPAPATTGVGALNPSTSQYQWFSGGGGSGRDGETPAYNRGGYGGGAVGAENDASQYAEAGTAASGGGGGGGTGSDSTGPTLSIGGNGGSGVVILRYKIAETQTAKASGGSISFYGGKTIHAFTSSGTFITPGSFSETCEYFIVAGGGGGGTDNYPSARGAGGGGAGGLRTGTTPIGASQTYTVTIGGGGRGGGVNGSGPGIQGGVNGSATTFGPGPLTVKGGGGGGGHSSPGDGDARTVAKDSSDPNGGSGGGGTNAPGTDGDGGSGGTYGNDGGDGEGGANYCGGGGGGAGGTGSVGTNNAGGDGGIGVQIPSTFRDPAAATALGRPGPGGASYWFAGGGAGNGTPAGGSGGGPGGPYAGGGPGGAGNSAAGTQGLSNTGGGGGGSRQVTGGQGGSGIVVIAYPT